MECSCDVGGQDYGDPIHDIDVSDVRAVSPCKCSECGRQFDYDEAHERYIYFWKNMRTEWDRKIMIYRMCHDCRSIVNSMFDGWSFETVFEQIENYLDEGYEIPSSCIARLTPRARDEVCDLIEMYWSKEREYE